jgi:hypothetical protein
MLPIKSLFIIFFSLVFTGHCAFGLDRFDDIIEEFAPNPGLSSVQLSNLRDELKIQTMFIEGVKGIEINGGEFKNANKAVRTVEKLIVDSFEAKASALSDKAKLALKESLKNSIDKSQLEKTMIMAKDFGAKHVAGRKTMLSSVARRWGFDVGMVYFLSMQIDLTLPSVMMAMGQMQYAPLLAAPVSSLTTTTYASLKGAVKFRHLVKNLGGLANAREHWSLYRKVKNFFHTSVFPSSNIINLNVAGRNFTMTIQRVGMFASFKQKLGLLCLAS